MRETQPAPQPSEPNELLREDTAIDVVRSFHREIGALLGRLSSERSSEHVRELESALRQVMDVEERHFYPAVEACGGEGARCVSEARDDHVAIRRALGDVQRETPGSPAWHAALGRLEEDILHHFEEEEADLLPAANACLDPAFTRELGDIMLRDAVIVEMPEALAKLTPGERRRWEEVFWTEFERTGDRNRAEAAAWIEVTGD